MRERERERERESKRVNIGLSQLTSFHFLLKQGAGLYKFKKYIFKKISSAVQTALCFPKRL